MLLNIPSHPDLMKIVVLNPKGGSGKSTLATNLSGYLAASGHPVALMDFDPQGSCHAMVAEPRQGAPGDSRSSGL